MDQRQIVFSPQPNTDNIWSPQNHSPKGFWGYNSIPQAGTR